MSINSKNCSAVFYGLVTFCLGQKKRFGLGLQLAIAKGTEISLCVDDQLPSQDQIALRHQQSPLNQLKD
jgi:hypothetical protein